jgi:hypothetical protein
MAPSDDCTVRRHVYEALDGPEHIRLIALHPASSKDAPLRINFFSSTLEDFEGRYDAVSYTWGKPIRTFALHIDDGTQVRVTENLDRALRYLRYKDRERVLWADAASINQDDDKEKEVQIPLMVKVFRGARKVMACLDPGGDTTIEQRAMRTMDHLSRASKTQKKELYVDFGEVLLFLNLPWFNRLWIIQEIVFSLEVRLICGETELPFSRFIAALSFVEACLGRSLSNPAMRARMESIAEIRDLWKRYSLLYSIDHYQTKAVQILQLVEKFASYECTDPRDRIYALYSMATNVRPREILSQTAYDRSSPKDCIVFLNIDYSLDVRETYKAFALACLSRINMAPVIWRAVFSRQHSFRPVSWPSWVPDWRVAPQNTPIPNGLDFDSYLAVASSTERGIRTQVRTLRCFLDKDDKQLYTIESKTSRAVDDSGVTFESQLLQMYTLLQKSKTVEESDNLVGRPKLAPQKLDTRKFPNLLVHMIRIFMLACDDEDVVSVSEWDPCKEIDVDSKLDLGSSWGLEELNPDDEDSDDTRVFRELNQHLASMTIVSAGGDSLPSSTSPSAQCRDLIDKLGQNSGDTASLFCFHDPGTRLKSVGYGNVALEVGDHILPVGDLYKSFRYRGLIGVMILRRVILTQESSGEDPVYRLVGSGCIFDPTLLLLRITAKAHNVDMTLEYASSIGCQSVYPRLHLV